MEEAVGLLRTIQPTPSMREPGFRHPTLTPARHTGSRVRPPGRRHQAHGIGVWREPFRIAPRAAAEICRRPLPEIAFRPVQAV